MRRRGSALAKMNNLIRCNRWKNSTRKFLPTSPRLFNARWPSAGNSVLPALLRCERPCGWRPRKMSSTPRKRSTVGPSRGGSSEIQSETSRKQRVLRTQLKRIVSYKKKHAGWRKRAGRKTNCGGAKKKKRSGVVPKRNGRDVKLKRRSDGLPRKPRES